MRERCMCGAEWEMQVNNSLVKFSNSAKWDWREDRQAWRDTHIHSQPQVRNEFTGLSAAESSALIRDTGIMRGGVWQNG